MKTELFKKLIKEAVREVLREELGTLISSESLSKNRPTTSTFPLSTIHTPDETNQPKNGEVKSINEILNSTRASMNREDFTNILGGIQPGASELHFNSNNISNIPSGPKPGLDLNSLGFVKNAAAIYNKANELSKNRFS